jgi:hypothetical protein
MATAYASIRAAAGLSSKKVRNAPVSKAYPSYSKPVIDPFGPQVANDIFEMWGEDCEPTQACDSSYPDSYEYEEGEHEHWYQPELPLENVRDLEDRYRQEINKFQRAYKKMMVYALQWHYLLEECDDNAQLEKMFKDLQMIRKLTGSEVL